MKRQLTLKTQLAIRIKYIIIFHCLSLTLSLIIFFPSLKTQMQFDRRNDVMTNISIDFPKMESKPARVSDELERMKNSQQKIYFIEFFLAKLAYFMYIFVIVPIQLVVNS